MEHSESIFQPAAFTDNHEGQLSSTTRWANFIGILYLIFAGLSLLLTVALVANMDAIARSLMEINGMSQEVIDFVQSGGKWLLLVFMLMVALVMFFNGWLLVRFRGSFRTFQEGRKEHDLAGSFQFLSQFLMLTTVLSVLSALSSVAMIIWQLFH